MNEVQKRIDELQSFYDRICENPLSVDLEVLPASIDWLVGEIHQLKMLLTKELHNKGGENFGGIAKSYSVPGRAARLPESSTATWYPGCAGINKRQA